MAALATTSQQSTQNESDTAPSPTNRESVDQRESRQRALQFLKEAQCTRRLVEKLEKDRSLSVQCRRNGWTDVATELDEYEKTLVGQRSAEKMQLCKQLAKIQNGVRQFQDVLINIQPSTEMIEKLKEIMSEVEISISELKEQQRLSTGELLKEERMCSQGMDAYKKKIENWDLYSKSDSRVATVPAVKSKALDRDLPIEVQALEGFLQRTGGICGGWDEFDHQAFLKVWTKYSGQVGLKKEAKLYLPNKSPEEVAEHKQWYQELIYLQNKRREAIQKWKSKKQVEHEMRIQKQVEAAEAKRMEKHTKCQQKNEEKKRLLAQQLEAWKEAKRRKGEEKRAEKIQNRTAKVCKTKERRVEQEDSNKTRKGKEMTKTIDYLIKRDLKQLQAKQQEKLLRQKQEKEHHERILAKLKEKVDGHIGRDPARLTQPTKGWEERMKCAGASGGRLLRYMSHRSVVCNTLLCLMLICYTLVLP
ncbi:coiled-coil domain-containing protein 112 isoform X3 [Corythoichthys intestinalis]|uniref:coiled-coil domain-containing protein 112 isoform X3 n=1 Tax=Corythoichthys intestinalis TaxID=161448 RepID=UPI0025A5EA29|nr:coiled-coil domain-containing protein 112 isoform X3 [Corythoichthys intestinalis]